MGRRLVYLGAASDIIPEIVSSHAEPGRDYPVGGVVVGNLGDDEPWTRRIFRLPDPPVRSRAARRRGTGNPTWFMSSTGPSAGALFVDTDGRRVQDGDDF